MTIKMRTIAVLLLAGAALPVMAQSPEADKGRLSVGITGGTLGIGPEIGFRPSSHFGVRANATFLSIHRGFDSDDISYRGKVKLQSGGVMLDAYPFGGGFRVSAGARTNSNKARVIATPTQPTEVGGTLYTPAQIGTLTGHADTKNFAPALTVGYGGKLREGFHFGVEAGALFEGRVRIRQFQSSSGLISPADLEDERQSIQDDVDKYKVYPILQFIVSYRF
ncbi:MAG TPA: hypothetical protein VNT42_03380 [Sphingomonas sp.]|nr:hypothetical protein [Sphingomonas sp.]